MLNTQTLINCAGQLVDLSQPKVMGILNLTPDSFFDGNKYVDDKQILNHVGNMLQQGADIIDIGGMSSRPGAKIIKSNQELERVISPLKNIVKEFPEAIISIDTIHAMVARAAVEHGASLVNDISAGTIDHKMFETVADLDIPYVLMHMQGIPSMMQNKPKYDHIVHDTIDFFIEKIGVLNQLAIKDIIIDPGFGFGKTAHHNFEILKDLKKYQILGYPILAGLSRKGMIHKTLNIDPEEALAPTTALNMVALLNGAKMLRVHDVLQAKQTIQLFQNLDPD